MKTFSKLLIGLICAGLAPTLFAHSATEDAEAGIKILFETSPLPAMTQQKSSLVFLVRDMRAEEGAEPVLGTIENAKVMIEHMDSGKSWGPFAVEEARRNPGRFELQKVFAYPGEYEVEITFNRTGEERQVTLHWDTDIADWNGLVLQ